MKFIKMQALGNDFICINSLSGEVEHSETVIKSWCDRRFGIGADGVLFILPSKKGDFRMAIYNADGTCAQMCGNGIRCLGKYVYEHKLVNKTSLVVETDAGLRTLEMTEKEGHISDIRVDMGSPRLNAHSIPILCEKDLVIQEPVWVGEDQFFITGVSMGNPHAVLFTDDVEEVPLEKLGFQLEFYPRFPERMNVEFCEVLDKNHLKMRVWERGVGETMACGTGACAAVVAAVLNHFTERKVSVSLEGGKLDIEWEQHTNKVYMTGGAEEVFEGELHNM